MQDGKKRKENHTCDQNAKKQKTKIWDERNIKMQKVKTYNHGILNGDDTFL